MHWDEWAMSGIVAIVIYETVSFLWSKLRAKFTKVEPENEESDSLYTVLIHDDEYRTKHEYNDCTNLEYDNWGIAFLDSAGKFHSFRTGYFTIHEENTSSYLNPKEK